VSWPGYVLFGLDGSFDAHEASARLSMSRDGARLLEVPDELCRSYDLPRVFETETGDEIATIERPADGFLLDVFWSAEGTVLRRVAADIESDGPCIGVRGSPVRMEELGDLTTGSWTALDDVGASVSELFREFTGGIEVACGPNEPLRWTGNGSDCSDGPDSVGFFFQGVALNAVNPRFVVGVYEP
jgi:hypothetical protein